MTNAIAKKWNLFVNGEYRPARSGKYFKTFNPATGEVLAHVAEGDNEDVNLAVQAARQALHGPWGQMSPTERGEVLFRIAAAIHAESELLATVDCQDAGRLLSDVRKIDLSRARSMFEFYGGLADKIHGSTYPTSEEYLTFSLREPYGVVGAIIPWNAPIISFSGKVAPALACGNTVVLKPAEQASLSSLALARICHEAGLPDGVLNVISGYGPTAGAALAGHMDVDKIAFTGSTETGRRVMELGARNLKSVTLELGGKSPNIVFADADLDSALAAATFSPFHHAGQICSAGTRLFVEDSISEEFLDGLVFKARQLRVGDPADERTEIGPLVSEKQLERVIGYIASGQQDGARLLTGGSQPDDPQLRSGYYITPTIFDQVDPAMRIAQEEIFGPVLATFSFEDEDQLVNMANDVSYGLVAGVWTQDISRATRLARRIEAGTVYLNSINVTHVAVPFGGFKQSGIGLEYGVESIETYTRLKTVWSRVESPNIE